MPIDLSKARQGQFRNNAGTRIRAFLDALKGKDIAYDTEEMAGHMGVGSRCIREESVRLQAEGYAILFCRKLYFAHPDWIKKARNRG